MKFFIDTANIDEIRKANSMGILDGVTTNPSLIAKEDRRIEDIVIDICKIVNGPVSAEVISVDFDGMLEEARNLKKLHPNVVVKVPITKVGLKVTRQLSLENIETNVTLVFSPLQALLAAKAGATYVSPFLGRLDDLTHEGTTIVEQIVKIYTNYKYDTKIIVASIRSPMHILFAALAGVDIVTIPFQVIEKILYHPLTDKGLAAFLNDWKNSKK